MARGLRVRPVLGSVEKAVWFSYTQRVETVSLARSVGSRLLDFSYTQRVGLHEVEVIIRARVRVNYHGLIHGFRGMQT
jgi:hypothetical protein